jgi:N-acetylglucosamine-6-phosphate deacetylase
MQKIFTADKIFTGSDWLPDHAVIIEDELIADVLPIVSLPHKSTVQGHFPIISPSFIDVQIYGAGGKLFATFPEAGSLHVLFEHCVKGGCNIFLPTVATNSLEVFHKCIDVVREYRDQNGKGVPGLHLEGPWINPVKRGAHIEEFIHAPSENEVKELLNYGKGVIKMITLAPEVCSKKIIDMIISEGIIISAGHSNADFQEALTAFDGGIEAATHLFNAMSPLHHRQPGLPAAIFQHHSVMASIIPDGFHVDFEMIKIAKKIMNERLFIITDAVTSSMSGEYLHTPAHQDGEEYYEAGGILSGSALTMIKAVKNLTQKAGVPLGEAIRMASLYPARLLGISDHTGMIRKGYHADIVFLDELLNII